MGIGLREWLLVLGALSIAFILYDGWRRMRNRERDRELFNLERRFGFSDETQPAKAEKSEKPKATKPGSKNSIRKEDEGEDELPLPSLSARDPEHHRSPLQAQQEAVTEESTEAQESEAQAARKSFEDVLVINVLSKDDKGFFGPDLLLCILESGLRFGERQIFHRHESKTGNGEVLFSMANAVKPGTFDTNEMDHCYIRAVAFYLLLPGPRNPKAAFNEMLAAVRRMEAELGGVLKDDRHSVLTAQTIEHYRQRISEFERKQRLGH